MGSNFLVADSNFTIGSSFEYAKAALLEQKGGNMTVHIKNPIGFFDNNILFDLGCWLRVRSCQTPSVLVIVSLIGDIRRKTCKKHSPRDKKYCSFQIYSQ